MRLPTEWLDIPIKSTASGTALAFAVNYTTFFYNILYIFNPFCCFVFKRNYIKKENSRKITSPYWRGTAVCKYNDVVAHLKIQNREENVLEITFIGDVNHNITTPKVKRVTGICRSAAIEDYESKNTLTPSKHYRDKLIELNAESFQSGNRSGVTHGTMKGIRAAAKRKSQFDKNLYTSISHLQHSIKKNDEDNAIRLGHMWRKCFGYVYNFVV